MTLLERLFSRASSSSIRSPESLSCCHTSLTPMWESVADMGEPNKISRYRCLECQEFLTLAQASAAMRRDHHPRVAA